MDRLIYTALSGASQTLYEQQISANNLANVNTNGFRADMAMATNDKVKGGGFDTRYMAQEGASGVNDSTGVAEKTERPLDVAIQGAGYIAVQDKNGNEVYTRNGNIQQDDQGQLTIDGNLVLGDNGPIILPPNAIASFGSDGTLSVTPDDGDVTATMDIDRLKLVDIPGAMLDQNNIMPTGLQFGSGVRIVGTQKTFTEGNVETTDNAMNVAIMGQGFLQVQKANGDIAYTRDGNLQVNADGVLTNSQGLPLQPEIDVPAGATNVAFGEDGTVTAILPGDSDVTELGQLTLVNFANPAGLSAEGDNLYLETAASGQPTEGVPGEDGLGTLQDNALEGSNVDIVNEMVAMITVQRAYEMNAKMVSAADDMLQYISQTL
ncbi:flagellar basal-body rod protein FlgG [Escherichia coli]